MLKKVFKTGLITILLFIFIFIHIFKPVKVKGNSMYPCLKDGDWVLVNKLSYVFTKPDRGDIIVFKLHRDSKYTIKRVIGQEKETVEIKFGKVYINNNKLYEPYASYSESDNFYKRVIPEDSFFVLGDNRRISKDSRYEDIGFINKKQIIGKIMFVW